LGLIRGLPYCIMFIMLKKTNFENQKSEHPVPDVKKAKQRDDDVAEVKTALAEVKTALGSILRKDERERTIESSVTPTLTYRRNKRGQSTDAQLRVMWKKGQSGNPKGRPKKEFTISDMLRQIGREELIIHDRDGKPVRMTRHEFVMRQAYLAAENGNKDFVKFIAERTEGKVPTTLSLMNHDDEKVEYDVIKNLLSGKGKHDANSADSNKEPQ